MRKSKIFSLGAGGSVATGVLQLASGAALDTTLRAVTDQANTVSPLQLSTTQVGIDYLGNIPYLDLTLKQVLMEV